MYLPNVFCIKIKNLDLNATAPIDIGSILTLPFSSWVLQIPIITNPSGDLHLATLGIYTGAAGSGIELVAPTVLNTLTAVGKCKELPLTALDVLPTNPYLYIYLTVAAGGAGTADFYGEIFPRF